MTLEEKMENWVAMVDSRLDRLTALVEKDFATHCGVHDHNAKTVKHLLNCIETLRHDVDDLQNSVETLEHFHDGSQPLGGVQPPSKDEDVTVRINWRSLDY